MKICIVDDSKPFRESLKNRLADFPEIGRVLEADGCRVAVSALASEVPDILILDVHLGDGTAFDLLKQLSGKLERTVVIVNTGFAYPQYRERAIALGAHHFVDKSDDEALIGLIHEIVEKRPRSNPAQRSPV